MGRPKAKNPVVQAPIYPDRALWEEVESLAAKRGEKPTAYATEALRQRVEREKAEAK